MAKTKKKKKTTKKPITRKKAKKAAKPATEETSQTPKPFNYSKPLESNKHERFCQEYVVQLNATDSYSTAYPKCTTTTARINGCKLLINTNIVGRIAHLQAKLSEASGVTAEMLMEEWKKIGFANIKEFVLPSGRVTSINQLTDAQAAAISSITFTKSGNMKLTFHSKETALENMGKHIGFYEADNKQKKSDLDSLLEAISGKTRGLPNEQ